MLAKTVTNEFNRYLEHGVQMPYSKVDYSMVKIPSNFKASKYTAEELADQITLMYFRIFERIEPRDCLGQSWTKKRDSHILGC